MMVTHDGGGRGARASMKDRLCVCVVARLCAHARAGACVCVCLYACVCVPAIVRRHRVRVQSRRMAPSGTAHVRVGLEGKGKKTTKKKSELLCDVLKAKCVTGGGKKKKKSHNYVIGSKSSQRPKG